MGGTVAVAVEGIDGDLGGIVEVDYRGIVGPCSQS
jgi:hypothetical protein